MLFNILMICLLFVGSRSLPQSDDKLCAATIYTNSTVVNVQYVWCLQVWCCPDGCIYIVTLLWYRLMLSVVWWCVSVTPVSLSFFLTILLPHLTSLAHGYLVMLFIFIFLTSCTAYIQMARLHEDWYTFPARRPPHTVYCRSVLKQPYIGPIRISFIPDSAI